jgi:hypothetical protein
MNPMVKKLLLLALSFPLCFPLWGQDINDYRTEFIWGINKNTSSGLIGGFTFKKSFRSQNRVLHTYGLEIINVKNPFEVRVNSFRTGNFFIFGKQNYLYTFRLQYGRDFVLFKKAPQQGVEIKAIFAGGPSLGLVAPYYIEYLAGGGSGGGFIDVVREQYDPEKHIPERILGTGMLFQGLGQSKFEPGANVKLGLSFEIGTLKSQVTGFELGTLLDAYTNRIILVPGAENRAVYPTAYITLFYGSRR